MTTDNLPPPIAAYFAATTPSAIADCFAEDGVAIDERRTHRGRAAIVAWREEVAKIDFTQELLSQREQDGRVIVTGRISGAFSGSPVELDYDFTLAGDRIAELRIS